MTARLRKAVLDVASARSAVEGRQRSHVEPPVQYRRSQVATPHDAMLVLAGRANAAECPEKESSADGDAILLAHPAREQRHAPVVAGRTAFRTPVRRLDQTGVEDVRRFTPAMEAPRFQHAAMRRTPMFALQLIQHAVIAARRTLPAIPKGRMVAATQGGIEQRRTQHIYGQAQHAAQALHVDDVANRRTGSTPS